jgi:hypothetical protein
VPHVFVVIYSYAWFGGFIMAFVCYLVFKNIGVTIGEPTSSGKGQPAQTASTTPGKIEGTK